VYCIEYNLLGKFHNLLLVATVLMTILTWALLFVRGRVYVGLSLALALIGTTVFLFAVFAVDGLSDNLHVGLVGGQPLANVEVADGRGVGDDPLRVTRQSAVDRQVVPRLPTVDAPFGGTVIAVVLGTNSSRLLTVDIAISIDAAVGSYVP